MSLTAAIVGAGLMGRWHAISASRSGATITAVVDADEKAARAAAQKWPGARHYTRLDQVFTAESPDVVHVCTPSSSHSGLCFTALDNGAHVICEKPLAGSAREVGALYDKANAVKRKIAPVHQFVTQRGTRKALRLLSGPDKPHHIAFTFCSAGGVGRPFPVLDEIVADILPHPLSVLKAIQPSQAVAEIGWQVLYARAGELVCQGSYGKIPVSLLVSLAARPPTCHAAIRCSEFSLHVDFFHGFCMVFSGKTSRFRKAVQPLSAASMTLWTASANLVLRAARRQFAYPGLTELISDFYAAVDDPGGSVDGDAVIDIAAARDALITAMRTRSIGSGTP